MMETKISGLFFPDERLAFPFPFVHHQPHDWKIDRQVSGTTINRGTEDKRVRPPLIKAVSFSSLQELIHH